MATILTTKANELSTYVVTVSFTDETGASVTPNAITWTLTDTEGNVINSRSAVPVSPAASVNIVLSGADLAIHNIKTAVSRVLTINATYDSDNGSDLPLKEEVIFKVNNLTAIAS